MHFRRFAAAPDEHTKKHIALIDFFLRVKAAYTVAIIIIIGGCMWAFGVLFQKWILLCRWKRKSHSSVCVRLAIVRRIAKRQYYYTHRESRSWNNKFVLFSLPCVRNQHKSNRKESETRNSRWTQKKVLSAKESKKGKQTQQNQSERELWVIEVFRFKLLRRLFFWCVPFDDCVWVERSVQNEENFSYRVSRKSIFFSPVTIRHEYQLSSLANIIKRTYTYSDKLISKVFILLEYFLCHFFSWSFFSNK